jgi:hypothetical protein
MVDGVNEIQTREDPVVGRPVRPGDGERRAIGGFHVVNQGHYARDFHEHQSTLGAGDMDLYQVAVGGSITSFAGLTQRWLEGRT